MGEITLQVEELQDLPNIRGVRLGWAGEDLLEPGQFQVVNVVESLAFLHDHPVQGTGMAALAFPWSPLPEARASAGGVRTGRRTP